MRALFAATLVASLSLSAFATDHVYESDTKIQPLTRVGKNLGGETQFPTVQLTTTVYEVRDSEQEVDTPVFACAKLESDGTKGDWKNFWNEKKDLKPGALKRAIRGSKLTDTLRLVNDKSFNDKPRTWDDFTARIAAYDAKYGSDLFYRVVVKNGEWNIEHLGYSTGAQACAMTHVKSTIHVRERVGQEDRSVNVTVHVVGGILLTNEKETFTLSWDGMHDNLTFESSYNTYDVKKFGNAATGFVYELTGHRAQNAPTNSLDLALSKDGNQLHITVSDKNFDPEADSLGSRKVVLHVYDVRHQWDPRSDILLGDFERTLENNQKDTVIDDLGVSINKWTRVKYSIRYENSPFFATKDSAEATAELYQK